MMNRRAFLATLAAAAGMSNATVKRRIDARARRPMTLREQYRTGKLGRGFGFEWYVSQGKEANEHAN